MATGLTPNSDGMAAGTTSTNGVVPALAVTSVSKTFSGNRVLSNVSMTLESGEIRMLLGGNGSGKSTFIKILSGYHHKDDGGEIRIGGEILPDLNPHAAHHLGARFVHQDLGLIQDSSILDNMFMTGKFPARFGTVDARKAKQLTNASLEQVGLDLDVRTLIRDLSPVQKTGVAIARAIGLSDSNPIRLLVLDEPTATLPAAEVHQLLATVRRVADSGVAVIYVTHRFDEVFELPSRVTILRGGSEVLTTDSATLTREELVGHIVGSEVLAVVENTTTTFNTHAEPALEVEDLQTPLVNGLTFRVHPGEILGFSGVTGSGRELINSAVFGATTRLGGVVTCAGVQVKANRPDLAIAAGIAFVPADRKIHGGFMNLSARENISISGLKSFWKFPRINRTTESHDAMNWFQRLAVRPAGAISAALGSFSGGNQQKVIMGKWMRLGPKVMLFEEPTQGVDVGAKAEIYRQFAEASASGSALVVSSADVDELVAVCHRVLVLRHGRIVEELTGRELTVANVTHASLVDSSEDLANGVHP